MDFYIKGKGNITLKYSISGNLRAALRGKTAALPGFFLGSTKKVENNNSEERCAHA